MTQPTARSLRWRWQVLIDDKDRQWLDGDQSVYFNRIMDLAQPIEPNDAATKAYVDLATESQILGVSGHLPMFNPDGSGLMDSGAGTADFEISGTMIAHLAAFSHASKVVSVFIPADAAAGDTWAKTVFAVPTGHAYTVTKISICPDVDIGVITNFMTLVANLHGVDGNVIDDLVTEVYDDGNPIADHVITSMGALDANHTAIIAGQCIVLTKNITLAGQAWPGGLVTIELTRTA
jgi:hypothetical protein